MRARRGQEGGFFPFIIAAAIAVVLLVLVIAYLYNWNRGARTATECDGQGGACKPTSTGCGDSMQVLYACKGEKEVCCKPADGSVHPDSQGGATGKKPTSGGTKAVTPEQQIAQLYKPTIVVTNDAKPVSSGQTITLLPGQAFEYDVVVTARYIENSICGSGEGKVDTNDPRAVCANDFPSAYGYVSKLETANGVEIPNEGLGMWTQSGPAQPTKLNNYANVKQAVWKGKIKFTAKPEYSGQTLRYAFILHPKVGAGVKPQMEARYELNIKVAQPVRVEGLSDRWSNKKTVRVSCTPGVLTCTNMYFEVHNTADCPKRDSAPPETPPLLAAATQYCIVDGSGKIISNICWDQQGACETERIAQSGERPEILEMLKKVNAATQNNDLPRSDQLPTIDEFVVAFESESSTGCREFKDPRTTAEDKLYKVNYDPAKNSGTIVLEHKFAEGKEQYLCVYGQDSAGKMYAVGRPQKILLDITPPKAEVKFRWRNGEVSFICIDDDGGSACNGRNGVSYVNEIGKFFPALFSKAQSPQTWCPTSPDAYSTYTKSAIPYYVESNELRVLCYRAQDNAGNYAYAMTMVYNPYDNVAKIIAMALR